MQKHQDLDSPYFKLLTMFRNTIILLSLVSCSTFKGNLVKDEYEEWFSAYLRGLKVGYNYYSIKKVLNGYEVNEKAVLVLKMLGQEEQLNLTLS